MNTPEVEWHKLEQHERKAKAQKIGGWGIGSGHLSTRAAAQPVTSEDAFEAFFHPKVAQSAETQTSKSGSGAKLDVNTATTELLQGIPGIGPVLAGRIIAARPFQSADDLAKVKGIGKIKFAKIRPHFQ